ncbi:probable methylthioribulose-1-phosphate dehydratase isoform X1 [Macrobrachium rosenbergii]|uniref:probable methylthioribulose-1-phosphate dehydratase isoform X1 n=1 Tax=Macrobrachium rosenbergii TaxID=79674 RepID=UPI0034D763D3
MSGEETSAPVAAGKKGLSKLRRGRGRKRVFMAEPVDEEIRDVEPDTDFSEAAKTDSASPAKRQQRRKKRASSFDDSDSNEEVVYNSAKEKKNQADPVGEETEDLEKDKQGSEVDADISEPAKTFRASPSRRRSGRNKRSFHFDDSDSDEEVFFNIAEKKTRRGRPKGHTLETGTWVARKPLGRPKQNALNQSLRRGQKHPTELICELGQVFYSLGWVSGTGGGISIKTGDQIYVAPSGVQKERLQPEDIFVLSPDGEEVVIPPLQKNLKISQCTPLFMLAYKMRGAGAVIHSHSKAAVMATLAYPGPEFRVTHLEMIKGIKCGSEDRQMRYDEELIVPIIENTPFEADLADSMSQALELYPDTQAVLVRRHGVYVWGDTWEKAKTMAESYDYLFDIAVQMKKFDVDPTKPPKGASEVQGHMNGK